MAIGKTPQNQLDALPLQDADTAAAGGVLQIIGGSIVKYFDGTALGINGAVAATVNTKVCLVSAYLDLRGTSKYMFTLRTSNVGVRAALPAASLTVQVRQGASDTPSASYVNGGGINDQANAIFTVTSSSFAFPATAGGGELQTALWAWDSEAPTGTAFSLATTIGSDVRFIVSWSTNPVAAANLFTANLWASS